MLLLNNDDVHELLDMKTCLEALETGYQDLAAGNAVHRPRLDVWAPSDEQDAFFRWGSMEGVCRTYGTFAIRMKSDMVRWPEGANEEKYGIEPGTFCGLVMLFSTNNGEPLAIINDGIIQHMRVGADAGLGVKYLAREDAEVVGIIGSGGMARTYLQAFAEVRNLKRVKVYSRSRGRRETYAEEMRELLGLRIDVLDNPEEVVRGSDVVSTCTDSIVPVLTDPDWLEPGMHVTNLDLREFAAADVWDRFDVTVRAGRPDHEPQADGKRLPAVSLRWIHRGPTGGVGANPQVQGPHRRGAVPEARGSGQGRRSRPFLSGADHLLHQRRNPGPAVCLGGRAVVPTGQGTRGRPRAAHRVVRAGHPGLTLATREHTREPAAPLLNGAFMILAIDNTDAEQLLDMEMSLEALEETYRTWAPEPPSPAPGSTSSRPIPTWTRTATPCRAPTA